MVEIFESGSHDVNDAKLTFLTIVGLLDWLGCVL